ncbi:hypothetical protein SDC9_122368 [bioreactor metagenome]|uniref:Uncharacterized protein n=1 Tax=bioreactor metagenome TaxID=1076179 RepID=A0A645CEI1_9ZZZZ
MIAGVIALINLIIGGIENIIRSALSDLEQTISLCREGLRLERLQREGVAHLITDYAVEIMRQRHAVDGDHRSVARGEGEIAEVVARTGRGLDREIARVARKVDALYGCAAAGVKLPLAGVLDRDGTSAGGDGQCSARKGSLRLGESVGSLNRDGQRLRRLRGKQNADKRHAGIRGCGRNRSDQQKQRQRESGGDPSADPEESYHDCPPNMNF